MKPINSDICPTCGLPLLGQWTAYVLLPADDVPQSGSRTEIVVSPGQCLRVLARSCKEGHVALRREP